VAQEAELLARYHKAKRFTHGVRFAETPRFSLHYRCLLPRSRLGNALATVAGRQRFELRDDLSLSIVADFCIS
jgi:hypothetical protein